MIQPTSIKAYNDIKPLGGRQQTILDLMKRIDRPVTNSQLSEYLGLPINCITGRVNELVQMGHVREYGKVENKYGRLVIAWEVVSQVKQIYFDGMEN